MTTKTKFSPILFSTEMVKAILQGSKTQTRRTLKPQPIDDPRYEFRRLQKPFGKFNWVMTIKDIFDKKSLPLNGMFRCPYGQIGDVLWVREAFANVPITAFGEEHIYKAGFDRTYAGGWKPSIHMPKKACRIFLKITEIRVERLQEINENDAIAEGVEVFEEHEAYKDYMVTDCGSFANAKGSFFSLWESINGLGSYYANPFVWVVKFQRIDKPKNFLS